MCSKNNLLRDIKSLIEKKIKQCQKNMYDQLSKTYTVYAKTWHEAPRKKAGKISAERLYNLKASPPNWYALYLLHTVPLFWEGKADIPRDRGGYRNLRKQIVHYLQFHAGRDDSPPIPPTHPCSYSYSESKKKIPNRIRSLTRIL